MVSFHPVLYYGIAVQEWGNVILSVVALHKSSNTAGTSCKIIKTKEIKSENTFTKSY